MKKLTQHLLAVLSIAAIAMSLSNCTKHNGVLDLTKTDSTQNIILQGDTLMALHVTSGPTLNPIGGAAWNGNLESIWDQATKLTVHAVVPDLGNNTFEGYLGNATDVTLRAMYDASNLYLLAEWNCESNPPVSSPWYFNPTTHKWAQMGAAPVWDLNGVELSPPFVQDQFAIMFNVNNSCYGFNSQSCYAACHVNTPVQKLDTVTGTISTVRVSGGVMYTNGPNEKLDAWRCRMVQVLNTNQGNDVYLDWGNGAINTNEVHNDAKLAPTDGGVSNKQSLTITGLTTKENVPMWIRTNGTYINGAIMVVDTTNGSCVYVCAVDSMGVLSYSATRGGAVIGTIDPSVGTSYKTIGTGASMTLGSSCVPGSIVGVYTGSQGDVTANAFFTGTGYKLLMKRALHTADVLNQDVDFSSLEDQPFGIGVMFNRADNEHAIVAGLRLHFLQ